MDAWDAMRKWDAWLDVTGISERTRSAYRYRMVRMAADLMKDPLSLDEDDVVGYLAEMDPRGHSRGDVTRAARSFYGWAEERGLVRSPVRRVKTRRLKYGPAPALADADVRRLADAAGERAPVRRWAVLFMYATGARVGTFVRVRPQDVSVSGEYVDLPEAKGAPPYRVPLGPTGLEAARELLALCNGRETLIGVGRGAVEAWVRTAAADAKVPAWPHLLRHSFATRLAESGTAPDVMRTLMNHSDYSQLARYVSTSEERTREAVARL
ncbi:MAG: tyrosine-type recombinase/integrase [Actinomycetota bacterium]|nr:tyrosine-type recombinase/integrase [Actinomycetota bacterium]